MSEATQKAKDQFEPLKTNIVLTLMDSASGHFKYYAIQLISGLEATRIRRRWGRIGYPGKESYTSYPESYLAEKDLAKTLAEKLKKGYQETDLADIPTVADVCPCCQVLTDKNSGQLAASGLKRFSNYLALAYHGHASITELAAADLAQFTADLREIVRQYAHPPDVLLTGGFHLAAHLLGPPPAEIHLPKGKPPGQKPEGQLSWL